MYLSDILLLLISIGMLAMAFVSIGIFIVLYKRFWFNQPEIKVERLNAYGRIMRKIIELNRTAVDLHQDEMLSKEFNDFVMGNESVLKVPIKDLTETYHSQYYIIDDNVSQAISEYLNLVSTYKRDGIQIEQMVGLSGKVAQSMRDDLGLSDISFKYSDE